MSLPFPVLSAHRLLRLPRVTLFSSTFHLCYYLSLSQKTTPSQETPASANPFAFFKAPTPGPTPASNNVLGAMTFGNFVTTSSRPFSFSGTNNNVSAPPAATNHFSTSTQATKSGPSNFADIEKAFSSAMSKALAAGSELTLLFNMDTYVSKYYAANIVPIKGSVATAAPVPALPTPVPALPAPTAPAPAPFGGFSFANSSSAPQQTTGTSSSKFSFDVNKSSDPFQTSNHVSAQVAAPARDEDDEEPKFEAGSKVGKNLDKDWKVLQEIGRVKYYVIAPEKLDEEEVGKREPQTVWTSMAAGSVRIEQHNSEENCHRLVLRNDLGNVQLNVKLAKGIVLSEKEQKGKSGLFKFILFTAVRDVAKGAEKFALKTSLEDYGRLFQAMKDATAM
jgi:hypothetical protein